MDNNCFRKVMILIVCSVIAFSTLAFALEEKIVKAQGLVTTINHKKNTIIVYETTYVWNNNTAFYDDKGSSITIDKLRPKSWVYIEGKTDSANITFIERLYLLPKHVDRKERHLYPFMEQNGVL